MQGSLGPRVCRAPHQITLSMVRAGEDRDRESPCVGDIVLSPSPGYRTDGPKLKVSQLLHGAGLSVEQRS